MEFRFSRFARLALALGLAFLPPAAATACSSCGCMLNANWDSQGYDTRPGLRLDVRYDDINQSQLRTGTTKVDAGGIALPADREIQKGTHNHNVTLGLDYAPGKDWGVDLELPAIDRPHTTVVDGDTDVSGSRTRHMGDARLTGRYQGFLPGKNLGVKAGLKLPTGPFHDVFRDGPQAGEPLDRGLQAGTGTTDLLLGVYHFHAFNPRWSDFTQASVQEPLNAREGFKPGASWVLTAGVRYTASQKIVPQLQATWKAEMKESGDQADRANSGGTVLYIAPGLTACVARDLSVYGFLQAPVRQNLNGYQLVPKAAFSLGLRYAL